MKVLGATRFDQCVINMSLIHLCNQSSYVGQELQQLYRQWKTETDEVVTNPWFDLHWFTIYVPHPDQDYEDITLEEGLTRGYNIEVKRVEDKSQLPYAIPRGGQFVVVLKQSDLNSDFQIAATGIYIRALAVLSLDIIIDSEKSEYQSLLIQHPIIRDYPSHWEEKVKQFLNQEINYEQIPELVGYVDQSVNQDYRSPSWQDIFSSTQQGLIHF